MITDNVLKRPKKYPFCVPEVYNGLCVVSASQCVWLLLRNCSIQCVMTASAICSSFKHQSGSVVKDTLIDSRMHACT